MSNSVVFPCTREQFDAEVAKAAEHGLTIDKDRGQQDGISIPFGKMSISWCFDPQAESLTITVLHKPGLVAMSKILGALTEEIAPKKEGELS